jgi:branched-chain amino acid transport system substrate-binding protein
MHRQRNILTATLWVAVSLLLVFAVTIPLAKQAEAKEAYKVGAIFAVTGRASFLGEPEKKTAEMIVEEVNKSGGINGHPLELVLYDDEGDATKCNVSMKKLINQDKVSVVIGPSTSGTSLAIVSVADKAQIPLISCAASKKIVMPVEKRHWVFKVPGSDIHVAQRIFDHMKSKGITKVGIMTGTTGFGASGREELLAWASEFGISIVADERYGPKDTDLTAQLTKIKGTDAQAVVNWSIGPTQVLAVKNWRALGMDKLPLYQSHGFGSRKNINLCGKDAEGVLCPLGKVNVGPLLPNDDIQKKVIMAYTEAYEKKYNEPISTFGGHAWDSLQIVIKALEAVGPDRAKIRDYVENLTGFVGQHGVFNYSAKDHNGLTKDDLVMVLVKNGDWAIAD